MLHHNTTTDRLRRLCLPTRRGLPPSDDLAALCDIYTYTTMISQCTTHHQLRRAMELVAEMRSKAITLNVHTYSALLNVCLKANELDLSLDVYGRMLAEGVTPNLVTYNTLLDIYNKTGRWRDALNVLELLQHQVRGRWPHRSGCCGSAGDSGGLWAAVCRDTALPCDGILKSCDHCKRLHLVLLLLAEHPT